MPLRIIFLCARSSSRSIMAASLLAIQDMQRWDIWSSPTQDTHGLHLAQQVLAQRHVPLIPSDHLIEPTFGMKWNEGIILCSGMSDT